MPGPSSSCKDYEEAPITKDDVNNIINKINERRNFVASGQTGLPRAANMNKIYWSEELAATAQRWVDQCDAALRPDREDDCRDLGMFLFTDDTAVGQAIVSVEGPAPGLQLKSMIDVWIMQTLEYKGSVMYYNQSRDWKTNYFTQLIWGETDRIGCGRARFYVQQKDSLITRLVCNFAPKGNIHGKPVYAIGYPATQCQQNKVPDRKFENLCRYFMENDVRNSRTTKPVTSLLRILNLSNKPELSPIQNNLKQVKFDVNETSEQRNQKTRHVFFNNSYAILKNMRPLRIQSHWNPLSNYSRGSRLQQFQQERGHSKVYHGHDIHSNNFGADFREPTHRNYPYQHNPPTRDSPKNYNYRTNNYENTPEPTSSDSSDDLRKYNRDECTRHSQSRSYEPEQSNCEVSHYTGPTPCAACTRDHTSKNYVYTTPPCQANTLCMGKHSNLCPCNTPITPCPTMPPRCQCNGDCKCFNNECATPCAQFRRSDNPESKDEPKKSGDLHYYDLLPNMAIRSGDNANEPASSEDLPLLTRDEWIQHDTTTDEVFRRISPKIKHKQVKEVFENKRNDKPVYDYIYDSSYYRERKRRSPVDDVTFKPFWQMDEYNRDKSTLLKSMRFTTLSNKKVKKNRRPSPTVRISQTTETITVKLKENSNIQLRKKNVATEKYLSFDELMHLRKLTSTESSSDVTPLKLDPNSDARRDSNAESRRASTPKTSEYTTNTPFLRKKHCTRKLTCTWTAPTVIAADGSVIVPGMGGDRGSKTPPGYVEGCTRTSTCTRDFMDRNKLATTSDETGSGEPTLEDEDYCEKRALDVRKRDSNMKDETVITTDHETYIDRPFTTVTYTYVIEDIDYSTTQMSTEPTILSEECVCGDTNTAKKSERIKRNEIKSYVPRSRRHNHETLSYGDLYYLVLQKIIQSWKNQKHFFNRENENACFCNAAIIIRGSILLILFIFLYNTVLKDLFI